MEGLDETQTRSRNNRQRMVNLALGQNRVLELIASGSPVSETMSALLSFLEEDVPDMLCSLLTLDRDGLHLRHCAAPSLPPAYSAAIDGAAIGPQAGSCGTAAYRREQVIVTDIETDPLWADYRPLARQHGLRACWSTPILNSDGRVLGTFALYFRRPGSPEPLHQHIIQVALHVAAIALGRAHRERAVYESEERYRLINLATNDAVWDWDLGTNTLWWNDGIYRSFGYPKEEVSDSLQWWGDRVHPDDRAAVEASLHEAADHGGHAWDEEYRFLRRDGRYADVQDRGYVMRDPSGKTIRMIGLMQDITERKQAEIKIRRLNRTHEMLSSINSAIVRLRERQLLFREACRIAVEPGQFGLAWIGLLDPSTGHLVPEVWSGDGEPQLLREFGAACAQPSSVLGCAVRQREAGYVNDVSAPESGDLVKISGFGSVIALPLALGGNVLGALVLHSKEANVFDIDEVTLLGELADNISFALEYLEKETKVRDMAYHEPVTGLPNRAALSTHTAQAIADARGAGREMALLLVNLDYFRDINNTLGHQNGDLLLQCVAARLRDAIGTAGSVASLGGDEFAILLPEIAGAADVDAVVRSIQNSLRAPVQLSEIPLEIEATLGIAVYPSHGETLDLLWQHADVALRTAKERHEPCLTYHEDIDHYDPQRLVLLGELRAAIDNGQLLLHYQPKIDLSSGRTVGVEALVRWKHPTRGLIFPDNFIPLAERTGLINPLTTAVIVGALQQGRAFLQQGFSLGVSVNLSARNLHDPRFCTGLLEMVSDAGFPLSHLTLEITETAIMADPARAKTVLTKLRDAGIHLSMDDFGIGQSSLTYLKDLPISKMKIDKSFVMNFQEPRNVAIVRSAIDLGRNMGLQVTAEGVEDADTQQSLKDLGCDLAQGYLFSKPLSVEALTSWLGESPWGQTKRDLSGQTD